MKFTQTSLVFYYITKKDMENRLKFSEIYHKLLEIYELKEPRKHKTTLEKVQCVEDYFNVIQLSNIIMTYDFFMTQEKYNDAEGAIKIILETLYKLKDNAKKEL